MRTFTDLWNTEIRLTDERREHILTHPEMKAMSSMEEAIPTTLTDPGEIVRSTSDPAVRLYYRNYPRTPVTEKFACVVVKVLAEDAFIITAYLTDSIKRGEPLWSKQSET